MKLLYNVESLLQVINQVMAGEGVGWLKLNRLKKLMEDESYRDFTVTKLNKGLNRKISPDDHIDDVVSPRSPLVHSNIWLWLKEKIKCLSKLHVYKMILKKNWNTLYKISVPHEARIQGHAKVPSGSGARSGAHLLEFRSRRHGFRVPDDGDCPHALLEQGPVGERLRQFTHVSGI